MRKLFLVVLIFLLFPITVFASNTDVILNQINQKVCDRLEQDLSKLAAIMEQLRDRKGITETRVAFGGVDTPIKSADYQITYAAEAIAFQKAQKYTSKTTLRFSLQTLAGKVIRAKNEVRKALDEE